MEILVVVLCVFVVVFAALYFNLKARIVEISDSAPETLTRCNVVLKLQNELKPYVKLHKGKVSIKVLKN